MKHPKAKIQSFDKLVSTEQPFIAEEYKHEEVSVSQPETVVEEVKIGEKLEKDNTGSHKDVSKDSLQRISEESQKVDEKPLLKAGELQEKESGDGNPRSSIKEEVIDVLVKDESDDEKSSSNDDTSPEPNSSMVLNPNVGKWKSGKKADLSRTPGLPAGPTLMKNSDKTASNEELHSEESKSQKGAPKKKMMNKSMRKPSEHLFVSKGLLQENNSIVTGNHSSDIVTAHFNSTRRKSITTNESPLPERDIEMTRSLHDDPLTYLKQFEVLLP